MTSRYPIDALLRPPVELVSTVVAGTAAWLAWIAPWAWMTTPSGRPRGGRGAWLPRAPALTSGPSDRALPAQSQAPARLPDHPKRDPGEPEPALPRPGLPLDAAPYPTPGRHPGSRGPPLSVEPGRLDRWVRERSDLGAPPGLEAPGSPACHPPLVESARSLAASRRRSRAPWRRARGGPGLHALSDRAGHILVLGTTRVGETRLAEVLITQDVHRARSSIIFDPKGDPGLVEADLDGSEARGTRAGLLLLPPRIPRDQRPL